MKSLIQQARHFRLIGRKAVMALAFASAISSLSILPALADNDDGYGRGDRHGDHGDHGQRDRHGDNGRREWRGDREGYGYPYTYAQPVYVPPPVYYEPRRESSGISIFFPIDLR